jgi:hypothetical protein
MEETAQDAPVDVLIGMRWTQLWRLAARPWVPAAALQMVRAAPETGLLGTRYGARLRGPYLVQRWRDRAAVDAWARSSGEVHAAPWARFAREADGTASWGIWHEVTPAA